MQSAAIRASPGNVKKTKIVCTLGPASRSIETLAHLMRSGMDVARLNFSHGEHADHEETMHNLRRASQQTGKQIAVLQDLQGPKIRVGILQDGCMELSRGQHIDIVAENEQSDPSTIPTSYMQLAKDVTPGDTILMDDGLIRMRVLSESNDRVRCEVEVGGALKTRKGINLPGVAVSARALTDKDLRDLDFGLKLGVDFVGLSFVRSAADVQVAIDRMKQQGRSVPIIAKIEKPEAVANLAEILDRVDGIMVARGDLGVEMGPEKVPLIQKDCIEQANRRGKLVITATQMLESMVENSFPTRAEASDVANAVLDQSDAVMLSAETATGKHPALVVATMSRIIEAMENSERYWQAATLPPLVLHEPNNAIAHAAAAAAASMQASAVVCVSSHGTAPLLLSDYRPKAPVIALVRNEADCRRLAAYWGVLPLHFDINSNDNVETVIARIDGLLRERDLAEAGAKIVITLSVPLASESHTNTLKIHTL